MTARIVARERVYDGWVKLDRVTLRMPDGAEVERHIEDHGPGAAVLPYDPVARTALLVSMPRAVVVEAGEDDLLEAPAGALGRDTPEICAAHEALEEAGVQLGEFEFVAKVWGLPTVSTDQIHLFLAPYGAADRISAGGGSAEEHENITVHELPLAELWARAAAGTISDLKTLALVYALKLRRPELFD